MFGKVVHYYSSLLLKVHAYHVNFIYLIYLFLIATIFFPLDSFDSGRAVSASVTSKGVSKLGKSTANGVAKHGDFSLVDCS
jgi:hypothetical protein